MPPPASHPDRLLVLNNPGRMSRHWLTDIASAAVRLELNNARGETEALQDQMRQNPEALASRLVELCRAQRITAVIGYASNSVHALPVIRDERDQARSFFGFHGIREMLFWSDHPHWLAAGAALDEREQPLLRQESCHHFVKSEAAALELSTVLGWPNCHGGPVAEDAQRLRPASGIEPDYDLIVISGAPPALDDCVIGHLDRDEPDVEAIMASVAGLVRSALDRIWHDRAPAHLRTPLSALTAQWVDRRRHDRRAASIRHLLALRTEHEEATRWLLSSPAAYFEAIRELWAITDWERTFVTAYLARFFRVGVFGSDWSALGIGGSAEWVPHDGQPAVYARGRIALTIPAGHDEEGLTHKPFQIAASGVPMLHRDQVGLDACFTPHHELETFTTPADSREVVEALLADPDKRRALAGAARLRLERDHTWERRLPEMLHRAGLTPQQFRARQPSVAA